MKILLSLLSALAVGALSGCSGASVGVGFGTGNVGVGISQPIVTSNAVYEGKIEQVETKNNGQVVLHFEGGVSYQVEGKPDVAPGQTVKIKKTKTGYAVQR